MDLNKNIDHSYTLAVFRRSFCDRDRYVKLCMYNLKFGSELKVMAILIAPVQ